MYTYLSIYLILGYIINLSLKYHKDRELNLADFIICIFISPLFPLSVINVLVPYLEKIVIIKGK